MKTPKGKVMIIGGAEEREGRQVPALQEENEDAIPFSILKEILPVSKNKKPIKVLLTALKEPDDAGKTYRDTFIKLGFSNAEVINLNSRKMASDPGMVKDIEASLFFSGGNQLRLIQTILQNPTCVGIGLGEDTALIVSKGNIMKCIGSGMVIVIDGSQIRYTNILSADLDSPLSVEGSVVHILAKGNGYKLRERQYIPEVK
ncbi:MAG TPA: hypothetical protein VHO03_05560 [Ignavibacteriales bacterium]|nr:hypothetical protein [Ignavibacteriales bacterium]